MQAPTKSRAVAAPVPESASLLVPTLVAVVATVTLLFLLTPGIVRAQAKVQTPPAAASGKPVTHAPVTTTGSAHGALAAQTADKTDVAAKEAPKALPKGTKPPTSRAVATTTEGNRAKAESTVEHKIVAAPVADTAVSTDADFGVLAYDEPANAVNRIWGADIATLRGARGVEQSTIFLHHTYDAVETEEAVLAVLTPNTIRPRSSEYAGAPFAVAIATITNSGTIGRRSGSAAGSFRGIERVVLFDEVEITLPTNIPAVVGTRLISIDEDALLKPGVKVASPTGVLEIVKVEPGRPVVARVTLQSGRIEEGQKLLELEGHAVGANVAVTAVKRVTTTAPETEVTWVGGGALLPSVQSFIMLGAGEREGVKAGDQFALVKRLGLGTDATEQRIALVRVVRVTAFGSTAIVIRQDQPGISVGGAARLVGRVQ